MPDYVLSELERKAVAKTIDRLDRTSHRLEYHEFSPLRPLPNHARELAVRCLWVLNEAGCYWQVEPRPDEAAEELAPPWSDFLRMRHVPADLREFAVLHEMSTATERVTVVTSPKIGKLTAFCLRSPYCVARVSPATWGRWPAEGLSRIVVRYEGRTFLCLDNSRPEFPQAPVEAIRASRPRLFDFYFCPMGEMKSAEALARIVDSRFLPQGRTVEIFCGQR
jgi:hypothetical protein